MTARRSLRIRSVSSGTLPADATPRTSVTVPRKVPTRTAPNSATATTMSPTKTSSESSALNTTQVPTIHLSPLQIVIAKIKLDLITSSQEAIQPTASTLAAIPAICFPMFQRLPIELQDMVWAIAMKDPIVVATLPISVGRFVASSSKAAILAFSAFDPVKYPLCPLYLPPNDHYDGYQKTEFRTGKHWRKGIPPPIEPIFVSPHDTLYMPEIYKLDTSAFLAQKDNQVIEALAIHSSSALRWGIDFPRVSDEGMILRNLGNLKKVLVLERTEIGDELRFRRPGGYCLSLHDMRAEPGTSNENSSGSARPRRHKSPWIVDATTSIRDAFRAEIEATQTPETGMSKLQPELQFWELQRREIGTKQDS